MLDAPIDRAASTNSRFANWIVLARTTRNRIGTDKMPSESDSFHTDVWRPWAMPEPLPPAVKIVSSKMMNSSGGMLNSVVVKNVRTVSTLPLR